MVLKNFPKSVCAGALSLINRYTKHHKIKQSQINPLTEYKREIAAELRRLGESQIECGGLRYRLPNDCTTFDVAAFAADYPETFQQYQKPIKQEIIIEKI